MPRPPGQGLQVCRSIRSSRRLKCGKGEVMRLRDAIDLLLLAALFGASFLFMRIAAPAFGAYALAALRVGIAALLLLPIALIRQGAGELKGNWNPLLIMGV